MSRFVGLMAGKEIASHTWFNRKRDRDVSTGDIPSVFVANALWGQVEDMTEALNKINESGGEKEEGA